MKKVFDYILENRWQLLAVMIFTAILDLIGLGGKFDFGAGFVLAFFCFIGCSIVSVNYKKKV